MARPPIPRRPPAWLRGARYAILAAALLVVMFGYQINALYTDSLWFAELGQSAVFRTAVGTRILLFFGFGLLFFLLCYLNLWLAERLNAAHARPRVVDLEQEEFSRMARRIAHWGALAGSAALAFLVGGNAATHWDEYLQFTMLAVSTSKTPFSRTTSASTSSGCPSSPTSRAGFSSPSL